MSTTSSEEKRAYTWVRRALQFFVVGMAFFVNGYLVGYALCVECIPPIALLNNIDYLILLGGIGTLPLAWWARPRALALLFIPSAIMFGHWYGSHFLPSFSSTPPARGISLRVATYNMQNVNNDTDQVYENILALDADVIGLQEVSPFIRSRLIRFAEEAYPHRLFLSGNERQLGLLSRYPIVQEDVVQGFGSDPSYIRAEIAVAEEVFVVYVFHAPVPKFELWPIRYDAEANLRQTRAMSKRLANETLPAILLCDCNATPRSRAYDVWDEVADEAFGQVGRGFGTTLHWPERQRLLGPLIRIDYVWYNDGFIAEKADVWPDAATSDHHPVIATLILRE